jgi:hypothetical protein
MAPSIPSADEQEPLMKKAIITIAISVPVIVIAYLATPLVERIFNPCGEIFDQTVTKVQANLDLISKKGGLWLETAQIQNLSERSERMAMALKTCCVAHHHGKLSSEDYFRCQSNLKSYDRQIEQVVVTLDEAQEAAQRQDSALVEKKVEQAKSTIAAATESAREVVEYAESAIGPETPQPPAPARKDERNRSRG